MQYALEDLQYLKHMLQTTRKRKKELTFEQELKHEMNREGDRRAKGQTDSRRWLSS
jgi:hypothetical protein